MGLYKTTTVLRTLENCAQAAGDERLSLVISYPTAKKSTETLYDSNDDKHFGQAWPAGTIDETQGRLGSREYGEHRRIIHLFCIKTKTNPLAAPSGQDEDIREKASRRRKRRWTT